MIQYNSVFFKSNQAVKLSILVHGEGQFWRKKNCDRSGWGPPVGLAIGIRGETSPF